MRPNHYALTPAAVSQQIDYKNFITGLSPADRLNLVRRFDRDNAAMPHHEIVFALSRGESLTVRSLAGELAVKLFLVVGCARRP
ncbi:hypothetical protein MCAMS1_01698 [biofilm metagenome]